MLNSAINNELERTTKRQATLSSDLAVANVTAGDTEYRNAVEARVDDVVKFEIAYSNNQTSEPNNIAHDVVAKIALANESDMHITAFGCMFGANVKQVARTATVKTKVPATLEYIPGSSKWRHNLGTAKNPHWVTETLTDGFITSGAHVPIGDVAPSKAYQGTITILARIVAPSLKVENEVKVEGQKTWEDEIDANPGDMLAYIIHFENTGNIELTNMVIRDSLPPNMTYVAGSTKLFVGDNKVGETMPDGVTNGGLNIGNYAVGVDGYVRFNAKVNPDIKPGKHVFRNVAVAKADQTVEIWNTTKTIVNK